MDVIYEIRPLSLKYSFSRGKKSKLKSTEVVVIKKGGGKIS